MLELFSQDAAERFLQRLVVPCTDLTLHQGTHFQAEISRQREELYGSRSTREPVRFANAAATPVGDSVSLRCLAAPEGPAYGASKAGLNAMSQSLAKRLAPHNIFVGVVAPGFVDTDMAARYLDTPRGDEIRAQSPLGRVAKPEEVALAVMFLAAEGAEFTTGAILDVNGASYLRT